jgi:hypothetical protein
MLLGGIQYPQIGFKTARNFLAKSLSSQKRPNHFILTKTKYFLGVIPEVAAFLS